MAKSSGLASRLFLAGFDVSGDIGSVDTIKGGAPALDITGIDKSAHERLGGIFDSEIGFKAFWNVALNAEHDVFKGLVTTDRHVSYLHGTTRGNATGWHIGKQMHYDPKRGADGSMTEEIQSLQNGFPLFWGVQLSAGSENVAAAGNLASLDRQIVEAITGVSTAFGATAILQAFSLGSGTATVAVQDSADNAIFADITGLVFTAVAAAPAAEQKQTATGATIRRYVRVNVTGVFTNLLLFVGFTGHQTATI